MFTPKVVQPQRVNKDKQFADAKRCAGECVYALIQLRRVKDKYSTEEFAMRKAVLKAQHKQHCATAKLLYKELYPFMFVDYKLLDARKVLKKAEQALADAISASKTAEQIAVLAEQVTNQCGKVEKLEVESSLRPDPDWN